MKKILLLSLLFITILSFTDCKNQKPQLSLKQGEFLKIDSSRFDTLNTGIVEIRYDSEKDTYYIYRSSRPCNDSDRSQIMSSPGAGSWSEIVANKKYRFTKNQDHPVLIIPFKMNVPVNLMNVTYQDGCCECPNRNECCITYVENDYLFCDRCPQGYSPCSGFCYTVRYITNPYKGSVWYFYDENFDGGNYKVINL